MKPEQAEFLRDYVLSNLPQEAQITRRVIAAIPDARSSYRPDEKSRSAFELAWHIAASDAWFVKGLLAGKFNAEEDTSGSVPANIKTVADILSYYDREYIAQIEKLKGLSGEALIRETEFFGVYKFPLVMYLSFLQMHEIHHRGQLSTYLRAMGSKVPSIYGGSYDEPFEAGANA